MPRTSGPRPTGRSARSCATRTGPSPARARAASISRRWRRARSSWSITASTRRAFRRAARRVRARDGSDAGDPVVILSVGRAVPKKGYDDLLRRAGACCRSSLSWRFVHVGGGPLLAQLRRQAERARPRRPHRRGAARRPQDAVLAAYREADLFVLASRIGDDGDRDGLPNVLIEALSQALPGRRDVRLGDPGADRRRRDRRAGAARRSGGASPPRSSA